MTTINVPLTLSYDTRGVASYSAMQSGKDQRRVNCHYEITRTAVDTQPDIALARRPGVTVDGSTYGATTQGIYLVGRDPLSAWDPVPWAFVKDGNDNKVVSSSTSVTILSAATYYPRFIDYTNNSGTNYAIVQMQNDQVPGGASAQEVYFAATINGWTRISDADFTGVSHRGKAEHLDGYMFIAEARNRIIQSALNDITSWTASDYITRTNTQDPPQGLAKAKDHLLFFGTDTVEAFRNAGNAAGSVLSRVTNSTFRVGLASIAGGGLLMAGKTNYYVNIGDLLFFLGRYGGSYNDASLVAYDGSRFIKISKPYEDTVLSSSPVYSLNRVTFGGKVAVAAQMTAPTETTQKWLMFFPDINEWFEWESTVYGPVNNNLHYAGTGSGLRNKLYTFPATNKWTDSGQPYTMTAQFKLPFPDLNWKTMYRYGVIADTLSTSQNLAVSFSRDDCTTFSTARNIDLSLPRKEGYRGGIFREMFVKLTHTDSGEVRLRRFYADAR
jgi:hypothetical protein